MDDETKFLRDKVQELQAQKAADDALLAAVMDFIDYCNCNHTPAGRDLSAKVEKRIGRPPGRLNQA